MKIPVKIRKGIEEAILIKARAKSLEQEAKLLTAQAKDTLLPAMTAYGLTSCALDGVGVVSIRTNKGSNINETKLREGLLIYGCSSEETSEIIEKASKSWSTEYVAFKEV